MIRFEHVSKVYNGKVRALDKIDLCIKRGELLVLIGPSGCGKTTLLEMINQLEKQTSGNVYITGQDISKIDEVELRRNIGYVIQQVGLLPHLSISSNIGLVPRLQKWDKQRIERRTTELLELVGMNPAEYADRFPHELSGGQKQRIGFLRALAAEPDVILMDEPFASLDPITRENLQDELKRIQGKLKKTIVFVTHDMDEALKLGEKIVVMKEGRIIQMAAPEELLSKPADQFVERFIGRNKPGTGAEALTLEKVMVTAPVTISPDMRMADLEPLQKRAEPLVVVDDSGVFLGMLTAADMENHKTDPGTIAALLQRDTPTIVEGSSVKKAYELLYFGGVALLPVVGASNKLRGIITRRGLAEKIYRFIWDANG